MYNKEYVHEQMIKCHDEFESIIEYIESRDNEYDPEIDGMLFQFEEMITSLWDRWVLFYTGFEKGRR